MTRKVSLVEHSAALLVDERSALRAAATVDPSAADATWKNALATGSVASPALVSLLDDWAGFSGLSYRDMLTAIFAAQDTVNREWAEQQPQRPDEVAAFYDRTDTITPLLLWWHATALGPAQCAAAATGALTRVGVSRVLDFGCGIGSTSLVLARAGFDVVLAEVARGPLRFAQWRMTKRNYEHEALDLMTSNVAQLDNVDAILAFDVFEHLPNARQVVGELDRVVAPAGLLCFNQAFVEEEIDQPQHYPQCGEVLVELHERGYRLAHLPGVLWVAQKAPLATRDHRRQALELRARISATRVLGRTMGPIGRPLARRGIRLALA